MSDESLPDVPLESYIAFGHEDVRSTLLRAFAEGRGGHAYLLTGPQGVGKATFARHMAQHIFAEDWSLGASFDPSSSRLARMKAGSHGDYVVVRGDESKDIPVDAIRSLNQALTQTPIEGKWRVVIVDGVERLNRSGANALLKNLEEPHGGVVFFLIAQNAGRILPTLRSRCQVLALNALDEESFHNALNGYEKESGERIDSTLTPHAEGSLGRLVYLHKEGGAPFLNRCEGLLRGDRSLPLMEILKGATPQQFLILEQKVRTFIHHSLEASPSDNLERALSLWEKVQEIYTRRERALLDPVGAHMLVFSLISQFKKGA